MGCSLRRETMRFRRRLAGWIFDVDPKTVWPQCLLEDPEAHKEMKTRAAKHHRLWLTLDACVVERRENDHHGQQEMRIRNLT